MKELLYALLKVKSEHTHKENFDKVLEVAETYLDELGDQVNITKHKSKDYLSMVITNVITPDDPSDSSNKDTKNQDDQEESGKREYDVLLIGHLDVVPADYPKAYEPYEKDGKIYGRGATDMKGTTAAMIVAFRELIEDKLIADKKIALMLTTDEEVGGMNGVGYLVGKENYRCKIAFVPDGADDWKVCTDEKAVYHFKVRAEGVAAHGSRPWKGDNAIDKLIKIYESIRDDIYHKWGKADQNDNWKPTINLGALHGGEAANKVPDFAEMKIDVRHPVEVDQQEIVKIIEKAVSGFDGISWEPMATGVAFHTDADNEYIQRWLEVTDRYSNFQGDERLVKEHGAADARFLSEKGIPGVISKPVCSAAHIDNEWVDWDSLVNFKDAIKDFIVSC